MSCNLPCISQCFCVFVAKLGLHKRGILPQRHEGAKFFYLYFLVRLWQTSVYWLLWDELVLPEFLSVFVSSWQNFIGQNLNFSFSIKYEPPIFATPKVKCQITNTESHSDFY